jgi:NAD(P)-dependent dehydrogenase (short-subunit alcohol dehydrogenase family)
MFMTRMPPARSSATYPSGLLQTRKYTNGVQNYLALKLDVTKQVDIDAAFKEAIAKFGHVDVVVNNAGYGLAGPLEELTEEQIRTQMEVNFFGLVQVTKKAMETMREQKPSGGLIQQVTSIGGQRGSPTFSIYCASKWAVEGFTEAISQEVKPEWGIKFTCVEPGGFRTDVGLICFPRISFCLTLLGALFDCLGWLHEPFWPPSYYTSK